MASSTRSLKGLNACVWALGRIATPEAVTALGRVKLKVRDERIAKQVAKAMAEAAERAGMSIEDLEEIAVPIFGLEGGGRSPGRPRRRLLGGAIRGERHGGRRFAAPRGRQARQGRAGGGEGATRRARRR